MRPAPPVPSNASASAPRFEVDLTVELPPPLKEQYDVGKVLGTGSFAEVRLCKSKNSNEKVAIKMVNRLKCIKNLRMLANEIQILRMVDHENIMSLIAVQRTQSTIYLVCEYVKGGDLYDFLAAAGKFSENQAALVMRNLASALSYLHGLHIVHRDVKLANLLVEVDNDGNMKAVKIGDFGFACQTTEPLFEFCGTLISIPKEVVRYEGYGTKVDIWAAGVVFYCLLCGYFPFPTEAGNEKEIRKFVTTGNYDLPDEDWGSVSALAKDLLGKMLQVDQNKRISAEEILQHPWLVTME